ncbi:MAG: hypothetical protein U9R26_08160 [Campylobacterota bacterium]|nr:hypothetical protein [Campylobacterota bacterium]
MQSIEPSLEGIDDYYGKESREKRLTIWIVILSGLLIGAIYGIVQANATVSDEVTAEKQKLGIFKQ